MQFQTLRRMSLLRWSGCLYSLPWWSFLRSKRVLSKIKRPEWKPVYCMWKIRFRQKFSLYFLLLQLGFWLGCAENFSLVEDGYQISILYIGETALFCLLPELHCLEVCFVPSFTIVLCAGSGHTGSGKEASCAGQLFSLRRESVICRITNPWWYGYGYRSLDLPEWTCLRWFLQTKWWCPMWCLSESCCLMHWLVWCASGMQLQDRIFCRWLTGSVRETWRPRWMRPDWMEIIWCWQRPWTGSETVCGRRLKPVWRMNG